MKLSNGNISLRALEPDDVELLYRWENDSTVWKVSNTHTPVSKFILASYIKSADKDIWECKELRLIIEDEQNIPVGTIELFDFEPYHNRLGVGIIIFEENMRQKGIASAALNLIMEYALNGLGIFQVFANVSACNIASLKLFEKMGFELIGIKKKWLRTSTGFEDEHLFQKFLS